MGAGRTTTVLGCALLASCAPRPAPAPPPPSAAIEAETARLNAWFEEQYEEQLAASPVQQTLLGRKTDYDRVDDLSLEADDERYDWRRASVEEMRASFDYDLLTPEAQTSYDLWAYQLERAEAHRPYRLNDYMFTQMGGDHTFFPQLLIAYHRVDDASDMEAYVSRIRESARALRQEIDWAKASAAVGVHPPRFAFDVVIGQARAIIRGVPFDDGDDNTVWADVLAETAKLQEAGLIDTGRMEELRSRARTALTGPFREAYEELIAWEEEDRPNASEEPTGVWALPNGAAYYEERLASQTTTAMTADQIHELGLAEVERIQSEMIRIKDQVGFTGDLQAFFAKLRDDKDDRRLYYPNTDAGRQAYLDDATAALERVEAQLPNYFGLLPDAELEVRRVEPYRERAGAVPSYSRGAPDGSRPGIFYVHLADMTAAPKFTLETMAYHEGVPGHHLQMSLAQELTGLPTFRTRVGFTAYTEGWGLYAESLATEMPGTFEDPYSRFGQLSGELWRAIRLVVDTGLHARRWTEEQAVQYALSNSSNPEEQIRSEVRRYLVLPGQATAYKIGMMKFQELRRRARGELGGDFDIRAFHDAVLGGGALPLTILEDRVDRWIDEVRETAG